MRSRHCDEVLDAPRHWPPDAVQQAEQGIAVLYRVADHANREQVVHLIDRNFLVHEFLLDRIQSLDARLYAALDLELLQLGLKRSHDRLQKLLTCATQRVYF